MDAGEDTARESGPPPARDPTSSSALTLCSFQYRSVRRFHLG